VAGDVLQQIEEDYAKKHGHGRVGTVGLPDFRTCDGSFTDIAAGLDP
jgi:hypothetical protein